MKCKLKVATIILTIIISITLITGIVAHQKKVNAKITREDVIEEFKANKTHFENVKQYMMTRSENYSIELTSIKEEISDEKTIDSVIYLVEDKGYNRSIRNEIYRNNKKIVVFIKPGNNCDEFRIIYTNHDNNKEQFSQMQDLGDDWILSYRAYDCFGEDIISDCAKRLIAVIVCLAMVIVTIMVVSISKQRT